MEVKVLKRFNCPNCGKDEPITAAQCKELVKEGRLPPGEYSRTKEMTPLIEPQQATFTVPTIINSGDICGGCGVEYIVKVELVDAPVKFTQVRPRLDGPLPPFFGKG